MTPQKWIDFTNAIGVISKAGRYGGTYAHYDLAMELASWVFPKFKLYIVQDYKRLKSDEQLSYKYASEANMINVALFNKRAKQWREENPKLTGNMRDYANLNELLVLTNMESYNAVLIGKDMDQKDRMIELRKLVRTQLMSPEKLNDSGINKLEMKK